MSGRGKERVGRKTKRAPALVEEVPRGGDEGAPVGTGTPLARAPLPPSSGQAGAKKG